MNIKKLKRELGKSGTVCRGEGNQVEVRIREATFKVDRKSGWSEHNLAAYLHSKMPVAVIKGS